MSARATPTVAFSGDRAYLLLAPSPAHVVTRVAGAAGAKRSQAQVDIAPASAWASASPSVCALPLPLRLSKLLRVLARLGADSFAQLTKYHQIHYTVHYGQSRPVASEFRPSCFSPLRRYSHLVTAMPFKPPRPLAAGLPFSTAAQAAPLAPASDRRGVKAV